MLFLKNLVDWDHEGTLRLKPQVRNRYKINDMKYTDVFAGPEPVFEVSKRTKGIGGKKSQGTLDSWVSGGKPSKTTPGQGKGPTAKPDAPKNKVKKQTPAEIEAEMKRIREQQERFKEEMRQRAEEAKKRKIEERAREKERKKEEKKLLGEIMAEWKKPRDDLECDDLKELPRPKPVHCRLPNHLFGDFLGLLEFFHAFADLMEIYDDFQNGVTFELLEDALVASETPGGPLFQILKFMLEVLFELQDGEDEEARVDTRNVGNFDVADLDKNILGRDEDTANQIKSATKMARWSMQHQGQPLKSLHLDEYSITEVLRLHLESAGAFRSDKSLLWLYQQRGGYKLSDDPGLQFRMEEPQILEAITAKTVYELGVGEKLKLLTCLMHQVLTFANVRDDIDEKFNDLVEAKAELRNHQIAENKRRRDVEETEKAKRREERIQKKEGELKEKENKSGKDGGDATTANGEVKKPDSKKAPPEVHMTERQREAIQSQKEKEERDRNRKEEIKRGEAYMVERDLVARVSECQARSVPTCLGRDRAYRRFWVLESIPGLFVEHDDDNVGSCCEAPTPYNPNSKPMDEAAAMEKVKEILDAREKKRTSEGQGGSDKENDQCDEKKPDLKTYSKKPMMSPHSNNTSMKQKVLATMNGTLAVSNSEEQSNSTSGQTVANVNDDDDCMIIEPGESLKAEVVKPDPAVTEVVKSEAPTMAEDTKPVIEAVKQEVLLKPTVWGACIADNDNCTVHSTILPKTHWSYVASVDEFDQLIDSLNTRGIRESDLKDKLINEREKLTKNLKDFVCSPISDKINQEPSEAKAKVKDEKKMVNGDVDMKDHDEGDISTIVDLALRDQILEMEEKIFFGTLGTLKIRDRQAWQQAIQDGSYDQQCDSLAWGGKSIQNTPFESHLVSEAVSRDTSRPASPGGDPESNRDSGNTFARRKNRKVKELASAILQVAQMLDQKYLKSPLGKSL